MAATATNIGKQNETATYALLVVFTIGPNADDNLQDHLDPRRDSELAREPQRGNKGRVLAAGRLGPLRRRGTRF
jgi:hypothetical protein